MARSDQRTDVYGRPEFKKDGSKNPYFGMDESAGHIPGRQSSGGGGTSAPPAATLSAGDENQFRHNEALIDEEYHAEKNRIKLDIELDEAEKQRAIAELEFERDIALERLRIDDEANRRKTDFERDLEKEDAAFARDAEKRGIEFDRDAKNRATQFQREQTLAAITQERDMKLRALNETYATILKKEPEKLAARGLYNSGILFQKVGEIELERDRQKRDTTESAAFASTQTNQAADFDIDAANRAAQFGTGEADQEYGYRAGRADRIHGFEISELDFEKNDAQGRIAREADIIRRTSDFQVGQLNSAYADRMRKLNQALGQLKNRRDFAQQENEYSKYARQLDTVSQLRAVGVEV